MSLRAYHGDPAVKAKYVARMQAHMVADELRQQYGYWQPDHDGVMRGCALGCALEQKDEVHATFERELGGPRQLAHLIDSLFESVSPAFAHTFPLRVLEAMVAGGDVTQVVAQFVVWLLTDATDGVITRFDPARYPDVQHAVAVVAAAHQRTLAGDGISDGDWAILRHAAEAAAEAAETAAEAAAEAAWTTVAPDGWAAWAAARAARAAEATAGGAAEAAEAAVWAAAEAAAGAGAEAARTRQSERMADKLIDLLATAPVPSDP
jgi:hypothetical protein